MPLRYKRDHNAAKIPGIRIRVNDDTNYEYFMQAIRQIFSIAFAEIPKECLMQTSIVVDDVWKDPAEDK